jgi:hypothetical protein
MFENLRESTRNHDRLCVHLANNLWDLNYVVEDFATEDDLVLVTLRRVELPEDLHQVRDQVDVAEMQLQMERELLQEIEEKHAKLSVTPALREMLDYTARPVETVTQ